MHLKKLFLAFSVMAVLTIPAGGAMAGPITITFDNLGLVDPNPHGLVPSFDVGGVYQIAYSGAFGVFGTAYILNPYLLGQTARDGGQTTFQLWQGYDPDSTETVILSRADQMPFDLISFDDHGIFSLAAPYATVTGNVHGGGTATDTIAIGGAPFDFVTESLPSTFVDLDSVVFSLYPRVILNADGSSSSGGSVLMYDNFMVSTPDTVGVPEPGTLSVFAVVLIGLAGLAQCRRASTRHALRRHCQNWRPVASVTVR